MAQPELKVREARERLEQGKVPSRVQSLRNPGMCERQALPIR